MMKMPQAKTGVTSMGLAAIALMVLHLQGTLQGIWWLLYVPMLLIAFGQENGQ